MWPAQSQQKQENQSRNRLVSCLLLNQRLCFGYTFYGKFLEYSRELALAYSERKGLFNETDREFLDTILAIGVKNRVVVDIGCGDGRHANFLLQQGAQTVYGFDNSVAMIDLATNHTKQNPGKSPNFQVADARHIPLANETVDVIISNFVIHYIAQVQEVFQEFQRVVKRAGHVIATFNVTDVTPGFESLYNQAMPVRLGQNGDAVIVQNLIKDRSELESAYEKSGFKKLEERELDHPHSIIDPGFAHHEQLTKHAVLVVLQKQ